MGLPVFDPGLLHYFDGFVHHFVAPFLRYHGHYLETDINVRHLFRPPFPEKL